MAGATFHATTIVLKKTKLGESDLILRMLCEDGSLLEAVAKGARKPTSTLSGRLELFNCASLLLASSKGLPIIKESKLIWTSSVLHQDPTYAAAAACIAEFAAKTAQANLEQSRFFDLTKAALEALSRARTLTLTVLVAAYLLKAAAILGARPSFSWCAICGKPLSDEVRTTFSYDDGGNMCKECAQGLATSSMPKEAMMWGHVLLHSTFDELRECECDPASSLDLLHLGGTWAHIHFNCRLKSVPSLISYCSI